MAKGNGSSSNNNSVAEDARYAGSDVRSHHAPLPPPPPPLSKKQVLLRRRQQQQQQLASEEREPWLFQSLSLQHGLSLPLLPPARRDSVGTTSSSATRLLHASASSPAPLSAFTDVDAIAFATTSSSSSGGASPFFLDVDSLKRLLPPATRLRPTSSGAAYGSVHQSNNRPSPQHHSSRRARHSVHASVRLEALTPERRRKMLKRKATVTTAGATAAPRKNALRMDGGKKVARRTKRQHEVVAAAAASPPPAPHTHQPHTAGQHHKKKNSRRLSYAEALAFDSDASADASDTSDDDGQDNDADEATRQRRAAAAQLNLTLDEYNALDAAFGGDPTARDSDDDVDAGDDSESMTARYRAVFAQFDVDGSGAISPRELRQLLLAAGEAMDDAELAAVTAQADANGDGEIDLNEFVDLMRARKRLLRVASHLGVSGTGPGGAHCHAHRQQQLASSSTVAALPPLKLATLQSKRQSQQFTAHYTRPTPTCLRPGAGADVTALRRELAVAEFGLQALDARVRDGMHWVQQHCPVRSLRAQVFCRRWGLEKVQQLVRRMQSAALARALAKWITFNRFEHNKLQANRFLKGKASLKLGDVLAKSRRRAVRRRFTAWRTACVRDARAELQCAAIELQRIIRGKCARLELARRRATAAAVRLQCCVRQHLARRCVQRMRRVALEHASAQLLQRCYRGYTGKRVARALFIAQREALAARRIQRAFRSHQHRELQRVVNRAKYESASALKLQCCVRQYLARRERACRTLQRDRTCAATTIQRYARGWIARRYVAMLRRRDAAAIVIQRWLRVVRARMRVTAMRSERATAVQRAREANAATAIQTQWRGRLARKLYVRRRAARDEAERMLALQRLASACTIQLAFRHYCARRAAQCAQFEKLQWLHVALMNRSALRIQATWRGHHGRLAAHLRLQAQRALELEAHAAAQRIQSIARSKLARREQQRRLQARERHVQSEQLRVQAAVHIQTLFRGHCARRQVAVVRQTHKDEAQRALVRLVLQTQARAAVKIQCCARRFLARVQFAARQRAAAQRQQLAECRLVHERAALVIQCALRRAHAQRLLRQRRHDLERRISLMASEKAADEIERLRAEQEDELRKLKLQLLLQESAATEAAATLRAQLERERAAELQQREANAEELAQLKAQTLLIQQQQQQEHSARNALERERTLEADRLRAQLESDRRAHEEREHLVRLRENEELAALKLAPLLGPTSQLPTLAAAEVQTQQDDAQRLQTAALAMRRDAARLTIQRVCLRHLTRRRLERMQRLQAQQLASLHDETERARVRAVQEQELALAKLKAVMDDETRAREQEVRTLELQMLERARAEKARLAQRSAAARRIQTLARGFLGREHTRAMQRQIEREREARARAIDATLAEAEAKVAQALAGQNDTIALETDDASGEGASEAAGDDASANDWVEYWDENAQASYFYNIRTQEASWTRPVSAPAANKALELGLAATAPALDHEQDSYSGGYNGYGGSSAEAFDASGYAVSGGTEGYADQYGYYDAYGQYHYYEEDPSATNNATAAAAAAFATQQMLGAGAQMPSMFPGLASAAYAYQAAMASMLLGSAMGFGNPMNMQQPFANTNSMLQQQQQQLYAPQQPNEIAAAVSESEDDATAAAAAPPDPWEKFFDQYTGAAYYYNSITGERYWA